MVVAVCGDDAAVTPLAAGQNGEDLGGDAGEALAWAAEIARAGGVEADVLTAVATSAPRGLALAAVESGAALVVVGSAAGGRAGQVQRGRTAERLLCGAASPIALVPQAWEDSRRLKCVLLLRHAHRATGDLLVA